VKETSLTSLAKVTTRVVGDRTDPSPVRRKQGSLPAVGPLLDREIDKALALLTSMAFEEVQRRSWHLQPNHFYWPLNDLQFLRDNMELWAEARLPAEIDWNIDDQFELAQRLATYAPELEDVREGPPRELGEFTWDLAFSGLDAYAYYGLVRDLHPKRIVEVGIGASTMLLKRALAHNQERCNVTLIDPGPPWHTLGNLDPDWTVRAQIVQDVDLDVFSSLRSGDILFYDGSHCVRAGSDVNWMLFEVLPRLAPGVWVHIHDLSWPRDYSEDWIFDEGLSWNEQYFVQAFLMHNRAYRVRLASVMLHHHKGSSLESLFMRDVRNASSLWIEKVL
jgi:hypothetical protein